MTMGFRNRPTPSRARYDASPMTGRVVVGIVGIVVIAGSPWLLPWLIMAPLAVAGIYAAAFRPDLFE